MYEMDLSCRWVASGSAVADRPYMPVERATLDNDSKAVGAASWVDCRIVVDLRFSSLELYCMNGLHYSFLCAILDSQAAVERFSYCCSFPPSVDCHTGCCKSCMCNRSTEFAEY